LANIFRQCGEAFEPLLRLSPLVNQDEDFAQFSVKESCGRFSSIAAVM